MFGSTTRLSMILKPSYYLNIHIGSGKTAMIKTLVSELMEEKELVEAQRWVLFLDAKLFLTNLQLLWNKINTFAERKLEKTIESIGFRIIVIDNIDIINPALQQGMVTDLFSSVTMSFHYCVICFLQG